jgi:hypothetical protein
MGGARGGARRLGYRPRLLLRAPALRRDVARLEEAPLYAALAKLAEADIVLVQGLPVTT